MADAVAIHGVDEKIQIDDDRAILFPAPDLASRLLVLERGRDAERLVFSVCCFGAVGVFSGDLAPLSLRLASSRCGWHQTDATA
jgi:hypothetical protein